MKIAAKAAEQKVSVERLQTLMQTFEAVAPVASEDADSSRASQSPRKVQHSWHLAIAAMSQLLKQSTLSALQFAESSDPLSQQTDAVGTAKVCDLQGLIFCGPAPIFSDLATLAHLKTWVYTARALRKTFQLPPATHPVELSQAFPIVTLRPDDPLAQEQFCLIQTPQFCWAAVVGCNEAGILQLRFSFEPSVVQHLWQTLQLRNKQTLPTEQCAEIQRWRQRFPVTAPHYRTPVQFSRELLRQAALSPTLLPQKYCGKFDRDPVANPNGTVSSGEATATRDFANAWVQPESNPESAVESRDVELLKVIAHEVRTPLTTIQTLTRLLLKRSDLPEEVNRRLDAIYRECSGQIDRFGLIFRAMELTHDRAQALSAHLMPISLQEVLIENFERWQAQAARRSLTLEVTTPKSMPAIAIRDPHLLDQVLTGLMEYLGHSLGAGSHIHLHVALAGSQLKLQLKTRTDDADPVVPSPMLEAVGQLLMFQPETGGLSLSLPVTKHLFEALGGKLTVRKHHQSEVLTIFLPLGVESDAY
jgi:His Kinase A (phospho-acceptor) domain